jgi:hypothetical protein
VSDEPFDIAIKVASGLVWPAPTPAEPFTMSATLRKSDGTTVDLGSFVPYEAEVAKLRAFTGSRQALRPQRTRAEFISDLCRDAGVEPPEVAP